MNRVVVQFLCKQTGRRSFCYKTVKRPDLSLKQKIAAPHTKDETLKMQKHLNLSNQMKSRILTSGPMTIAEYMKEVLTNPYGGYYMNRDVFGKEGDFITSPEICQIFGELVAIWCLTEWQKLGAPSPFQIVELGPGRGTLALDVLKILSRFKIGGELSLHLVEISPYLSKIQAARLCFKHTEVSDEVYYLKGETLAGTHVYWYKSYDDVPQEFSIVLAHEFFDALPVHKLQKDGSVWKEVLIDVDGNNNDGFRYVLSKSETPISMIYQPTPDDTRECLEYSIETDGIIQLMADRFYANGGIGLIMDYGHSGDKFDTFRAFKKHKLHDPLVDPGSADLTADVDFKRIKYIAEKEDKLVTYGPVEQATFLKNMEGDVRLKMLLEEALPENQGAIQSGYEMLTDSNQMGLRFKFFALYPSVMAEHLDRYPVSGFGK